MGYKSCTCIYDFFNHLISMCTDAALGQTKGELFSLVFDVAVPELRRMTSSTMGSYPAFIPSGSPSVFLPGTSGILARTGLSSCRANDRLHGKERKDATLSTKPHHRVNLPKATAENKSTPSSEKLQKPEKPEKPEQTFFGLRVRTNGDVLKFGVVATAIPFAIKYGLQTAGMPDLLAGQVTTGFVSVFALLAWVSTYVFRVGTKQMTYAEQLREYENRVIQKRYEELTDEELAALNEELDEESS